MNTQQWLISIAVMALVTYLIRMLPLVLCSKKITNKRIQAFLYYVPYAVLSAMTFPDALFSTDFLPAAVAGIMVALVLSYLERSLMTVALSACVTVFAVESVMRWIV